MCFIFHVPLCFDSSVVLGNLTFFLCLLFLYFDFSADGTYALKKVLIQNEQHLEQVRQEIRVSSQFSHPNLLPLLENAIIAVKVRWAKEI
jgi:hypothetical protein